MLTWQSGFFGVSKAATFGWARTLATAANAAAAEKTPVLEGCAPFDSSPRSVIRHVSRYYPDDAPCSAIKMSCTTLAFFMKYGIIKPETNISQHHQDYP
ncbi:MAG: hypothetical protein O7C75_19485 [Verrucomicrobia bacterium]|nr:hypothetical protein [Verrucomicrobiota bacterium]